MKNPLVYVHPSWKPWPFASQLQPCFSFFRKTSRVTVKHKKCRTATLRHQTLTRSLIAVTVTILSLPRTCRLLAWTTPFLIFVHKAKPSHTHTHARARIYIYCEVNYIQNIQVKQITRRWVKQTLSFYTLF